jgi:hypothetical protein
LLLAAAAGVALGEQARFPRESVSLAGGSHEYVRIGDESSPATFHFCPHGGMTVYYELEGLEEFLAIPVEAFADPNFPPPSVSVQEALMNGWVGPAS